ncbi:hypothetical protein WJX79_008490 [Trebouxia sp. C0005]
MYKYGQDVEGFPTPTTGSDHTGSAVAKASRVLFAQTSDARCSGGLQNQQHQGHMTTERDDSNSLDLAQQNKDCLQPCLSDLSKEDLQELWNFTQAFPCLQNYQPADQLSGCESEVQQQQLSYLAQLLQDKASRGHALPDQALSHVTIDSQPADRNNPSAGSDSLHGMHCGSNNSREAGADLQVSQASGLPGITDAHTGPHQGRALQPDRSPHQATSLFLGQAPGQSPALQQGLHQTWVPQQDMSNQHRPQQGKSAQQGPQQARVASSGPQPQRSSRRLGQKRKEALLASKCSPDDAIQYPPAVNADAYGHEPDSLAVGGSGVSCTAGLAAKYLGEAAHMTGPIRKRDHLGEAARVAEPAYSQSCSLTPARPLGGPVMTLPGPVIMAISRGRDDSMCISRQSHGRRFSPESSVGISVEVDLLADPSDMLGLSPDRPEVLDDFDDAQHYVARFQEDLPADPMEGLAIPSWHELLDEAATQLTPQGFPRTGPALASERGEWKGMHCISGHCAALQHIEGYDSRGGLG